MTQSRPNSGNAIGAVHRATGHLAKAALELSQVRTELAGIRGLENQLLVLNETLHLVTNRRDMLLQLLTEKRGLRTRAETPEEGP